VSKLSTTSSLIPGVIEDVDIYHIKHSPGFLPSMASGLTGLMHSINEKGLLHPITIRSKGRDFEIVAGNRRYLACKALGWRKILCHIIELDDKEAFEISLIENIQRKTLSPIEEAHAFKAYVSDYGWGGISDLSIRIGKSVAYVDKRLGLLDLPSDVIEKISHSLLSTTLAEELIPLHDEEQQSELAELITKKRLSCKQVRILIKDSEDSLYDTKDSKIFQEHAYDLDRIAQRSIDKSIIAFRMAMNKIAEIMVSVEDNWIIYEALMQHRSILHTQIDLLIKEKRKI
jgi:ParB family transcriptional regulator, chromosome partitioning protein